MTVSNLVLSLGCFLIIFSAVSVPVSSLRCGFCKNETEEFSFYQNPYLVRSFERLFRIRGLMHFIPTCDSGVSADFGFRRDVDVCAIAFIEDQRGNTVGQLSFPLGEYERTNILRKLRELQMSLNPFSLRVLPCYTDFCNVKTVNKDELIYNMRFKASTTMAPEEKSFGPRRLKVSTLRCGFCKNETEEFSFYQNPYLVKSFDKLFRSRGLLDRIPTCDSGVLEDFRFGFRHNVDACATVFIEDQSGNTVGQISFPLGEYQRNFIQRKSHKLQWSLKPFLFRVLPSCYTDFCNVKIAPDNDNDEVIYNGRSSTIAPENDNNEVIYNRRSSTIAPENDNNEMIYNRRSSTIAPENDNNEVIYNGRSSTIAPENDNNEVIYNRRFSTIAPENDNNEVIYNRRSSTIAPENNNNEVIYNRMSSTIAPENDNNEVIFKRRSSTIAPENDHNEGIFNRRSSTVAPEEVHRY